ncbi:MAG: thioredoxin family protein [Pirellulales bacterium]
MRQPLVVGSLLFLFACCSAVCTSAHAADPIAWNASWEAAQRSARQSGRPMLVLLSKEHCPYCTKLKSQTLTAPEVVQAVNGQFVPVKLDGPQHQALVKRAGVKMYPTLLVMTADNRVINKIDGFVDSSTLTRRLASPPAVAQKGAPKSAPKTAPKTAKHPTVKHPTAHR